MHLRVTYYYYNIKLYDLRYNTSIERRRHRHRFGDGSRQGVIRTTDLGRIMQTRDTRRGQGPVLRRRR